MDKNNLSKKVGLLLAGCFITFNALGQTTIKGQVVDATGEPVIGASILVKDTKNGAVSDLDGNYKLDNVEGKRRGARRGACRGLCCGQQAHGVGCC